MTDSEVVIRAEQVSKLYYLNNHQNSFREFASNIFKKTNKQKSPFWALKDVSFELKKGGNSGRYREKRNRQKYTA